MLHFSVVSNSSAADANDAAEACAMFLDYTRAYLVDVDGARTNVWGLAQDMLLIDLTRLRLGHWDSIPKHESMYDQMGHLNIS